jgi:hypothetical protein
MSTRKTIVVIAFLIVAIGVLLAIKSLMLGIDSPADNSGSEPEISYNGEMTDQIEPYKEGWKIYQNNDYKFALQYPEGKMTLLAEPKREHAYCNVSDKEDDCVWYAESITSEVDGAMTFEGMSAVVINRALDDQSIHKYDKMPVEGQTVNATEGISIGGKSGYKFNFVTPSNYKIRGFMIPIDDTNFLQVCEVSESPLTTTEDWEGIISTFKFL